MRSGINKHAGLGLIEIMIALALGAIIMLGVTEIATQNSIIRNELERFGRQMETANYAMGEIEEDVLNAAFWGTRGEVAPGTVPPLCADDATELEQSLGYPIQGARQATIACSPANLSVKANTDVLAIRRVSSCTQNDSTCYDPAGANFYMQVHACFNAASPLQPGDSYRIDTALGTLQDGTYTERDCATVAPIRRFLNHIYYLNADDELVRASLEAAAYVPEVIAENVEIMRFEYGLDSDGDGQVDDIVTNLILPTDVRWAQVVMVRVSLVVRNHEPSAGYVDNNTYVVGGVDFAAPAGFEDHRRRLYTRTMDTRNISGRRET